VYEFEIRHFSLTLAVAVNTVLASELKPGFPEAENPEKPEHFWCLNADLQRYRNPCFQVRKLNSSYTYCSLNFV